MGKRRSKKLDLWLTDTVAIRMLKQVFPAELVKDITDALSSNNGEVFITRSSSVCSDFEWHVAKIIQPRDIIQYIDSFPCSYFKLYVRKLTDAGSEELAYSFYFKVHLNFREKARVLAVLIPIYKNCKNPEDKAKLKEEIKRIKYGGFVLRTNIDEVKREQASDSSDS